MLFSEIVFMFKLLPFLTRCSGYSAAPEAHATEAVALAAAWGTYGDGSVPVAVLATASPCKFEASITEATGPSADRCRSNIDLFTE